MTELSNSARLLRSFMKATGITDAKAIAAETGIPLRTIYRLKVDLAQFEGSATSAICAADGTAICAISAMGGTAKTAICAADGTPTCNQQKEIPPTPPKEKYTTTQNYPNQQPLDAREPQPAAGGLSIDWPEIKSAFNGSTLAMVAEVDRAMGGNCRREAETWMANLLRLHGQKPVAEAYHALLTQRAQGSIVPKPLAFWSKTAKNLADEAKRTPPPAAKSKIPTHMQRY